MADRVESLSCLFSSLNKSQPKGHMPRQSRQVKCTPFFSICGIYGFMEYIGVIVNRGNKCFKLDSKY